MEQKYPGKTDIVNHFYEILPALMDSRYMKIENRPIFVIYKPYLLENQSEFMTIWNKLIKDHGFDEGFFFIGYAVNNEEIKGILDMGFDAVNIVRTGEHRFNLDVIKKIFFQIFKFKILKKPLVLKYSFISKYFIQEIDKKDDVFPTLIPNWDHTPRSGNYGVVFHKSTPKLFMQHVLKALEVIRNKPKSRQILFLKSWNEWGEGNYMEPDLRFGRGYIHSLRKSLTKSKNQD